MSLESGSAAPSTVVYFACLVFFVALVILAAPTLFDIVSSTASTVASFGPWLLSFVRLPMWSSVASRILIFGAEIACIKTFATIRYSLTRYRGLYDTDLFHHVAVGSLLIVWVFTMIFGVVVDVMRSGFTDATPKYERDETERNERICRNLMAASVALTGTLVCLTATYIRPDVAAEKPAETARVAIMKTVTAKQDP